MCYSAKCRWEDHMGDCRFHIMSYTECKKMFGVNPCELPTCLEEEEWMQTEEYKEQYKRLLEYVKEKDEERNAKFNKFWNELKSKK